ncbi:hypothetical protein ACQKEM_16695 [Pseudomonas sp. NPDC077382]
MDFIKVDNGNPERWGVVYSYGSVLTVFDNEQDAQTEAISFGGAVVRLACSLWNTLNKPAEVSILDDQPHLVIEVSSCQQGEIRSVLY